MIFTLSSFILLSFWYFIFYDGMTSQNECTLIKWHIEFFQYTIEVNVSSNNIINDACQLSNVVVYGTCPGKCCFKGSCGNS